MTRLPGKYAALLPQGTVAATDAVELENLGYSTLWLSQSPPADLRQVEMLLAATESLVVGTDIVNVWTAPVDDVAASFHRIDDAFPGRFILGIGVGHSEHLTQYQKPYAALVSYLDALDAAGVPAGQRALAALGPRVLGLARDRTAGALPYFVTPEHTRRAREILGHRAFLSVGQSVVLDSDKAAARELIRPSAAVYLGLQNYVSNLRRLGFPDDELGVPATDWLIDAIFAHGDAAKIMVKLQAHLNAGADQVGIAVITRDSSAIQVLADIAPLLTDLQ